MSRQPENGVQFSVTKSIREEAEDERRLLDGGVKISPGELRGAGRGRIDRHDVGRRDNGGTDGDRRVRACVELVASRCARMRRHGDDGRHGRLGRREPRDADAGREDKDARTDEMRDARSSWAARRAEAAYHARTAAPLGTRTRFGVPWAASAARTIAASARISAAANSTPEPLRSPPRVRRARRGRRRPAIPNALVTAATRRFDSSAARPAGCRSLVDECVLRGCEARREACPRGHARGLSDRCRPTMRPLPACSTRGGGAHVPAAGLRRPRLSAGRGHKHEACGIERLRSPQPDDKALTVIEVDAKLILSGADLRA